MARFLVNLEIIVEGEDIFKSEIETAMQRMLQSLSMENASISDYGLDVDYLN